MNRAIFESNYSVYVFMSNFKVKVTDVDCSKIK